MIRWSLFFISLLISAKATALPDGFCFEDEAVTQSLNVYTQICSESPETPECPLSEANQNDESYVVRHPLLSEFIGSLQNVRKAVFDFGDRIILTPEDHEHYHAWMTCLAQIQGHSETTEVHRYWLLNVQTELMRRHSQLYSQYLDERLKKSKLVSNSTIGGLAILSGIGMLAGKRIKASWQLALHSGFMQRLPLSGYLAQVAQFAPMASMPISEQVDKWKFLERNTIPLPPNYYLAYNISKLAGATQLESDAMVAEISRLELNKETFAMSGALVAGLLTMNAKISAEGAAATAVVGGKATFLARAAKYAGTAARGALQLAKVAAVTAPISIPIMIAAEVFASKAFEFLQWRSLNRKLERLARAADIEKAKAESLAEYSFRLDSYLLHDSSDTFESAEKNLNTHFLILDSQTSKLGIGDKETFMLAASNSTALRSLMCWMLKDEYYFSEGSASQFEKVSEGELIETPQKEEFSELSDWHLSMAANQVIEDINQSYRRYITTLDDQLQLTYKRMQDFDANIPEILQILSENESALLAERHYFVQRIQELAELKNIVHGIPGAIYNETLKNEDYREETKTHLGCY